MGSRNLDSFLPGDNGPKPAGWVCADPLTALKFRDLERRARADDIWGLRNAYVDLVNAERLAAWEKKRSGLGETDLPRSHTHRAEQTNESGATITFIASEKPIQLGEHREGRR